MAYDQNHYTKTMNALRFDGALIVQMNNQSTNQDTINVRCLKHYQGTN